MSRTEPATNDDLSSSSDEGSGSENKNEKLQKEVLSLKAKLKGYETLAQLHQDSKAQLRQYIKKYGALDKDDDDEGVKYPLGVLRSGISLSTQTSVQEKDEPVSRSMNGELLMHPSNDDSTQQELTRHQGVSGHNSTNSIPDATPPLVPFRPNADVQIDSAAFIQNEYEKISGVPVSGDLLHFASLSSSSPPPSQHQNTNRQPTAEVPHPSLNMPQSLSISAFVPQMENALRECVGTLTEEESKHLTEAARMSLLVVKLEKDNAQLKKKIKELMNFVATVTMENDKVNAIVSVRIPDKERQIADLKKENATLLRKLEAFETPGKVDEPVSSSESGEWVTVEKKTTTAANQGETESEDLYATDTTTDHDIKTLLRKMQHLETQKHELITINKRWDEYCERMKADHQTQTQRLQLQVEQVQGELLRYRTQEERRQKDIDTLLLSAKKKTEVLEVEKEEVARQLTEEKAKNEAIAAQLRDAETLRVSGRQQTQRLEVEINRLKTQLQNTPFVPPGGSPPHVEIARLKDEIHALKQQLTIFKDDFDSERVEKERALGQKCNLEKERDDTRIEMRRLRTLKVELEHDRDLLKDEVRQKREEIHLLERQNRELQQANQSPYQAPAPVAQQAPFIPPGGKWPCRKCTYHNASNRRFCEMCGELNWQLAQGQQRPAQVPVTVQQVQQREYRRYVPRGEDVPDLMCDNGDENDTHMQ